MSELRGRSTRRQVMLAAVALAPLVAGRRAYAEDHGRINPPLAVPDLPLMLHDGRATSLPALLVKHASALQLMFTSCTTTCPIQGAIFRRVQDLIPDQAKRSIQLVSLSVDPAHDTPAALSKWLERFGARPGWVAAAPKAKHLEQLREFAGRGQSAADNHSTRIQIINRDALLIWRTYELPQAEEIAGMLGQV